jgi:glycosyltransferase involved in cell wall biosynthesis
VKLVIWHQDRYPTAPGVYLGCFPELGHEITWVTSGTGPKLGVVENNEPRIRRLVIQRPEDSGLPRPLSVLVNRWYKLRTFLMKVRMMNRLARQRPDVLQVRELVIEGLLGLMFARRYGIRFVFNYDYPHFEARLYELDQAGRQSPLRRFQLSLLIKGQELILRKADFLLPLTEAQSRRIQSNLGISPRRMTSFPVGISRDNYQRARDQSAEPYPALNRSKPIVCYMGNLAPIRNPGMLFRVMEEVLQREPETQLLLIGQLNATVKELMGSYSRPEQVVTTGFLAQEDIPSLMKNAGVGVFPLPVEDPYGIFLTSSPLKVVEYMSCGLPVVASRIPDAVTLLEGSGGGVVVENNPAAFAEAVIDFLRHPEKAEACGRRGQEYIGRHRIFDVMALELEKTYHRLLGDEEPGSVQLREDGLHVEGREAR